jgi:hypothetical protein
MIVHGLLASPMDEEPMAPRDAQPDDLVVVEAVERIRRLAPRLVPKTLRAHGKSERFSCTWLKCRDG